MQTNPPVQNSPPLSDSPLDFLEQKEAENKLQSLLQKKGLILQQLNHNQQNQQFLRSLNVDDFDQTQQYYLKILTKYCDNPTLRYSNMSFGSNKNRQLFTIKQNLHFLTTDQIVRFNDDQSDYRKQKGWSKASFMSVFLGGAIYKYSVLPTTSRMGKPLLECLLAATVVGGVHLKYHRDIFMQKISKYYQIIELKKNKFK